MLSGNSHEITVNKMLIMRRYAVNLLSGRSYLVNFSNKKGAV